MVVRSHPWHDCHAVILSAFTDAPVPLVGVGASACVYSIAGTLTPGYGVRRGSGPCGVGYGAIRCRETRALIRRIFLETISGQPADRCRGVPPDYGGVGWRHDGVGANVTCATLCRRPVRPYRVRRHVPALRFRRRYRRDRPAYVVLLSGGLAMRGRNWLRSELFAGSGYRRVTLPTSNMRQSEKPARVPRNTRQGGATLHQLIIIKLGVLNLRC